MQEAEHAVASADVLLVVGTSSVVYPAAGLIPYARHAKVKVIEVNVERTPYSDDVDCCVTGPAGEVLPRLIGLPQQPRRAPNRPSSARRRRPAGRGA